MHLCQRREQVAVRRATLDVVIGHDDIQEVVAAAVNNSAEFARGGYYDMTTKSGANISSAGTVGVIMATKGYLGARRPSNCACVFSSDAHSVRLFGLEILPVGSVVSLL